MLSDFFENRLREALQTLFGTLDDNTFSGIQTFFEWVDVQGGACLFRQGDEADGMYVVASGRLRVFQQSAEGKRDAIAEIAAGETVGEMALITGEPRNADVMAMRDSVLARISLKDFERLTAIYPQALLHISRNIIERLQKRSAAVRRTKRINNIGVCPVSEGADKNSFVHALRQTLSEHGEVLCIDSKSVDQSIGMPGISQCARGESAPYRHLASWLEQQESLYRFVLYIPDEEDSEWTHRCFRQADEVLLVGVAGQSSEIHPLEKRYLSSDEYHSLPGQSLVLLHAPDTQAPTGTAAWLQGRNLNFHHHVRQEHAGDFARLALITRSGPSDTLPYSAQELADFERRYCYDKFWNPADPALGSRYLCCGHAFVMVGQAGDRFFANRDTGLLGQFRHQYFLVNLIAHFHKAALMLFSEWLVMAISQLDIHDVDSVKTFKREIRRIFETFLRFTHRYWFHEVSNQAQAKDLFRMLTGHFDTDRIYQDVSEAVKEMNQYLDSDGLRRQANTVVRLTVVTTLGLIATVLTGFLGMNIFDYASESFWIKLLIVMGVLTPTILLVFYGVAKSKVLSDFLEALSDERLALRDKLGVLFKVWRKRPPKIP